MGLVNKLIGRKTSAAATSAPAAQTPGDRVTDGALDTLGTVVRTMGDLAFPLDDGPDPDAFRSICHDFACHVENGAPVPAFDIEQQPGGHREWGQVRRFFIDRRTSERDFVLERLGNYRGVVDDLVHGLREIGQRDQDTANAIRDDLGQIEAAVSAGSLPQIKSALDETVESVSEKFARQKEEYEARINALNERMSSLREDLVATREKMQRDSLTGAYNRGAFDTAIEQSLNMHFILQQPVTVVLIDLDNFKGINDNHGHAAGDEVLRQVGDCLARSFIRKSDLVARYGGDEFAVILNDTPADNAAVAIERFQQHVTAVEVPYSGGTVEVTCSIGYAELESGDTVVSAVKRADEALYAAKDAGRNCARRAPQSASTGTH